ncbi:DUF1684 domain-containing protein [Oleiharenicola lentus]|uniref:DUF1684 domain-containing protein n=1 Tax=Oleiharenicola lentus TaxID=2508720 RepID=UPI003F66C66D
MLSRLLLGLLISAAALVAQDDYAKTIEQVRAERVAQLTASDSWLTLVGRHALQPGKNTLGTATENSVRLASGPPYLGIITLEEGVTTFRPAPSSLVKVDGETVRSAVLQYRTLKPTRVTFGTANFYIMERGDTLFVRMRDTAAPNLKQFAGIEYFPTDPAWRIEAQWMPFEKSRMLPVTNMIGQTSPQPVPGKAVFTHAGKTVELLPIDEGGDHLFFVLTDLTAGEETYEASRFLYAKKPKAGETKIILDFNQMQNPPCAFTEFATCPLPPKENQIPFRVTAGEKKYRGKH